MGEGYSCCGGAGEEWGSDVGRGEARRGEARRGEVRGEEARLQGEIARRCEARCEARAESNSTRRISEYVYFGTKLRMASCLGT